jgi:hypothetical protein
MKTLAAFLLLIALWAAGELAISYYSPGMEPSCTTIDGIRERVTKSIINIKEQQLRQALISLGWKPPQG